MELFHLYAFCSMLLFGIALHGFLFQPHLVRKVLALNVMGTSIFLFLIAVAHRDRTPSPDPVPHALVLTGIVVAVSLTAFALGLILKLHKETGRTTLPSVRREAP